MSAKLALGLLPLQMPYHVCVRIAHYAFQHQMGTAPLATQAIPPSRVLWQEFRLIAAFDTTPAGKFSFKTALLEMEKKPLTVENFRSSSQISREVSKIFFSKILDAVDAQNYPHLLCAAKRINHAPALALIRARAPK